MNSNIMPEHSLTERGSSFKSFSFDHIPTNNNSKSLAFGNIPLSMLFEIDPHLYTTTGDISTNTSTVVSPALPDHAADILSPSWNQIDEWYNHSQQQDHMIDQQYDVTHTIPAETSGVVNNVNLLPQSDFRGNKDFRMMQTNAATIRTTDLLKLHQFDQEQRSDYQNPYRQFQNQSMHKSHEYYQKMASMEKADKERWPQRKSSLIQLDHTINDRRLSLQTFDQFKRESSASANVVNGSLGSTSAPSFQQHISKVSRRYSSHDQSVFDLCRTTEENIRELDSVIDHKKPRSIRTAEKKPDTECAHCGITKTTLWRSLGPDEIVCNACGLYKKKHGVKRPNQFVERYGGVIRRRRRNQNDRNDINKPKKALVQQQPKKSFLQQQPKLLEEQKHTIQLSQPAIGVKTELDQTAPTRNPQDAIWGELSYNRANTRSLMQG